VGSAVGLGNGIYNTTGLSQSFAATSRRAKVVRAALVIENDGNLEDDFLVRGSQGNRSFKIVYQDTGNRTAEVVAGTHATGAVDPGGADALTIIVTPNRKVLLKSVRRKGKVVKVWKRAEWRGTLTSNSQADGARSDTALFQVKHR
jgi:hypothetical protein